ncbi:DUF1461 domain-containing protein [Candidatus Woesearchaeota archaeon]|nr:DUF1461 domain-containing protein [Candidatus Woesearchaeota archaeon]
MKRITIGIVALMIFQIIILASFRILIFNEAYYKEGFAEFGTYERDRNADEKLKDVLSYLEGTKQQISYPAFEEREKSHLQDVKSLIHNAITYLYALIILLAVLIAMAARKKSFKPILTGLTIGTAAMLATAIILFLMNGLFPQLFEVFHQAFFPQGNYTFPYDSTLIRLFPEAFFRNFAYDIIKNSSITSALLLTISLGIKFREKFLSNAKK